LHVMLALSKSVLLKRNTLNDYSTSYRTVCENGVRRRRKEVRPFSELEISIQKIWYLLMNGQKVTAQAIRDLPLGYSCTLDRADDDAVVEVFKYAIKSFDDENRHLEFEQFKTLYYGLRGRRLIEGYGAFRGLDCVSGENIDQDIVMSQYDSLIEALKLVERPKYNVYKSLSDVKGEMLYGDTVFINRKALYSAAWGDTWSDVDSLVGSIIHEYNESRQCVPDGLNLNKGSVLNLDQFYEHIRQMQMERRSAFMASRGRIQDDFGIYIEADLADQKKRQYLERTKARARWVCEQLKLHGVKKTDLMYVRTVLNLKVQWNNAHPTPRQEMAGRCELPF